MVIYPEGVWYCYRTPEDVDEILRTHLIEGRRVERLMLHPEDTAPPGLAPPAKDRAAST
jgi:(2Fe-2S) ferredoxin